LRHHCGDVVEVVDRGSKGLRLTAQGLDFLYYLGRCFAIAAVVDGDIGAIPGQAYGDAAADAPPAPVTRAIRPSNDISISSIAEILRTRAATAYLYTGPAVHGAIYRGARPGTRKIVRGAARHIARADRALTATTTEEAGG
jgi:hypothetical protein